MEATAPPLPHLPSTTPSFRRVGRPAARLNSSKKREPKEKKKLTSLSHSLPLSFNLLLSTFPSELSYLADPSSPSLPILRLRLLLTLLPFLAGAPLTPQLTRNRWFLVFADILCVESSRILHLVHRFWSCCVVLWKEACTWDPISKLSLSASPLSTLPHTRRLPLPSSPHLLSTYLSLHHCLFLAL